MKKSVFLTLITALTFAFIGCTAATNTNNTRNNANVIVTATPAATANTANTNRWNSNISKEEYEKNRADYEKSKGSGDTFGQSLEDSWLWFKVRSALMTTADLRESTIDVDVAKDVVTLKGTVADDAQKKKAEEVAKVDGVSKVVNQLKVAPKDSMTNTKGSMTDSDKTPAPKK
jgi:hypothetical protein